MNGSELRQAGAAVDAVIDAVNADTRAGNNVSLFGFGTLASTSYTANVVKFSRKTAKSAKSTEKR